MEDDVTIESCPHCETSHPLTEPHDPCAGCGRDDALANYLDADGTWHILRCNICAPFPTAG